MITGTRYRLTLEINRQAALARDIERGQTEISTGKRIQAPSDDPVGAARVSDLARAQANQAAWKTNLDFAAALSSRADTVIGAVSASVIRAQELMVAGASDTLSADNRATIATELRAIAEEIEALSQTRDSRGEPLFPDADPVLIPAGDGVRIAAVGRRDQVFGNVATAGGPRDIAAIVSSAADALVEPDAALRRAAIQASIAELDATQAHVSFVHGEQGARGNRIDNLIERIADFGLEMAEERSTIESANVVEVVARMQSRQLTLEAAQAAFARINRNTLFDLIR